MKCSNKNQILIIDPHIPTTKPKIPKIIVKIPIQYIFSYFFLVSFKYIAAGNIYLQSIKKIYLIKVKLVKCIKKIM